MYMDIIIKCILMIIQYEYIFILVLILLIRFISKCYAILHIKNLEVYYLANGNVILNRFTKLFQLYISTRLPYRQVISLSFSLSKLP